MYRRLSFDCSTVHIMSETYMQIAYRSPLLNGWDQEAQDTPSQSVGDELTIMLTKTQRHMAEMDDQIATLSDRLRTAQVNRAVAEKKAEKLADLISELEAVKETQEQRYANGETTIVDEAIEPESERRNKRRVGRRIAWGAAFIVVAGATMAGWLHGGATLHVADWPSQFRAIMAR